jgi:hypothetical protein
MRPTTHVYLTSTEVAALAKVRGQQGDVVLILAYTGLRFGELTGLNVEDVDSDVRRHSCAPLNYSGWRTTSRRKPEIEGGPAIGAHPRTTGANTEGAHRQPTAGRSSRDIPKGFPSGPGELEAGGPLADGNRDDWTREVART